MNPELIFALQLLLAHILTDFVLQTKRLIDQKRDKRGRSPFLYIHAILAGLLTYIIVQDWSMWLVPIIITMTHFFIDLWKLHQKNDSLRYFLLDQMFHLLVLVFVWLYVTGNYGELGPFIASVFASKFVLVYLTGYLVVIFPIGFIIGKATQRWQEEIKEEDGIKSLDKAGRYIGIFERILVLTFIMTNNFSAIGFLIAAKSILRFNNKSKSGARKQTEYVLIGTLMSFAFTIIIGFLMRILIF